ncbi:dynein light chain 1, cytoplasmic-like [Trichechus manatus latirostris]|uniref:Dynein light chain n=1 Tax=Trichechus manatus latirostris TaxID=127582 RepID=A0A2Y9RPM9_TRIMA|nr:dynein light chain 1, cytoplasmic-like [Trichechus manatus latirostris]
MTFTVDVDFDCPDNTAAPSQPSGPLPAARSPVPPFPATSGAVLGRRVVIKNVDMSEGMQEDAIECASQAQDRFSVEKDIAAHIKKEFDRKYGPIWHCVVGRNFGSYVTHETKHFIYLYFGPVAILLFKSG